MFLKSLGYVLAILLKLTALLTLLVAALAAIMWPSFVLTNSIHWIVGVVYGVLSFVLITALLLTLAQQSGSDSPVWDWLERS